MQGSGKGLSTASMQGGRQKTQYLQQGGDRGLQLARLCAAGVADARIARCAAGQADHGVIRAGVAVHRDLRAPSVSLSTHAPNHSAPPAKLACTLQGALGLLQCKGFACFMRKSFSTSCP